MTRKSTRAARRLPPPFEISTEDRAKSSQAWSKRVIPEDSRPLIRAIDACLENGKAPSGGANNRDKLKHGGTLIHDDIRLITHARGGVAVRLSDQLDELKTVVGALTGVKYTRNTIKAYGDRKIGTGPHRDANLDGTWTPSVASVGLRGVGRFCLWVVPEVCEVDIEESMTRRDVDFSMPLIVEVEGKERSLTPVEGITMYPGDIIDINETPGIGTWQGPDGYTQLWHSARLVQPRNTPQIDVRWAALLRGEEHQ